MPFLVEIAGMTVAIYWFVIRTRNAANVATDLCDVANDVRRAIRLQQTLASAHNALTYNTIMSIFVTPEVGRSEPGRPAGRSDHWAATARAADRIHHFKADGSDQPTTAFSPDNNFAGW